ncbi:MAG: glycosyltransferase family 1 protein [Vicingaceae bacterium]|jgi:glycosyltransferase involved in cell wall biosynthesis
MNNKKNIVVDLERLKYFYNGLGQFCFYLGKYLSINQPDWVQFHFLVPTDFIGKFGDNVKYITLKPHLKFIKHYPFKIDLWHTTHQGSEYLPPNNTRQVLTIHDLNFLYEKSDLKAQKRLKKVQKLVNSASLITCISNYVKNDISNNLNLHNIPIEVIYNGVELETHQMEPPKWYNGEKFFCYIGVIEPKKNLKTLIGLIEQVEEDIKLFICGNKQTKYAATLLKEIAAKKLENKMVLPGIVSSSEKTFLLKNCEAFLFPSLIEGFGIPPIEAMKFGKPVFVAKKSSLPEVCGDAAFYWEDFNPLKMVHVLQQGLEQYNKTPEIKEKITLQAAKYNWQNTAKQYIKVYENIFKQ